MRKSILALGLLAPCLLALAACGRAGEPELPGAIDLPSRAPAYSTTMPETPENPPGDQPFLLDPLI